MMPVWQTWNYSAPRARSVLAEEQTRMFEELAAKAREGDATNAAGLLRHLYVQYLSGTEQRTGSHLDAMVERHRRAAAREIIGHLRQVTGENLGDSPSRWIERYAPSE
ncbi:MAG TPA: hypothetical protein PKE47_01535 [Verrucomicrobiota bacterium]|nr:hypothetical protein [Verrucomicrobiota bacterium]